MRICDILSTTTMWLCIHKPPLWFMFPCNTKEGEILTTCIVYWGLVYKKEKKVIFLYGYSHTKPYSRSTPKCNAYIGEL